MTVLSFCACIALGRCTATRAVFTQSYGKMTIWDLSVGFKRKHLLKTNLMHGNTNDISQVPLHRIHHMGREITSLNIFSLNSFLVLLFYTKIFHFKRRWKIWIANPDYANLSFISNNVSFRKVSTTENILWNVCHPYFIKSFITINASNGVHARFVHCILCVYRTFQFLL